MKSSRSFAFALALLAVGAARADIAADTFGTGDSYDAGVGYTVSTATSVVGTEYYNAQQFTSATTGVLTKLTIAAFYGNGSGRFALEIYADDGSDDVGALLGSTTGTLSNANPDIFSYAAPAGVSLVAGSRYWIGMRALDDSHVAWDLTSPVALGLYAQNFDTRTGSFETQQSAYRIETQPAPEPASMLALGLGTAAALRRRKRA